MKKSEIFPFNKTLVLILLYNDLITDKSFPLSPKFEFCATVLHDQQSQMPVYSQQNSNINGISFSDICLQSYLMQRYSTDNGNCNTSIVTVLHRIVS